MNLNSNQAHYDNVTDAWTHVLGANLHYGYFVRGDETLSQASDALIDTMAALAPIGPNTALLDVGCGIGNPAFRLTERTGCRISAISNSGRGIEIAEKACRSRGGAEQIAFYRRDALDNGFPDSSYDVAWVMESSHLIRDKQRLCEENYRVLRAGGTMLLCDVVLKKELSVVDVYELRADLSVLERTFGKAKMETLDFYEAAMRAAGFARIERRDISREAFPTLKKWKENLERNRGAVAEHLAEDDIKAFAHSCDILERLFIREWFGYGILKGVKDG